jgi:hypothetical protein
MRHSRFLLLILALLPAASGCKKGEITVRRVPKETVAPMMTAGPSAAAAHPAIEWKAPKGWAEQPASVMRAGSFIAKAGDGSNIEISIVPLGGEAGGELANVNRWRGQLSLPPVDDAGLSAVVKTTRIGAHDARLVEFANPIGRRLLAAVVKHGATSWFFKATGDDRAVKELKPAFLAFVESVRFHDHE